MIFTFCRAEKPEPVKKEGTRLSCGIREQESRHRVDKYACGQQATNFGGDVASHVRGSLTHLIDNLRTPVNHGNHIFKIMTSAVVVVATSVESLKLCGNEIRRRDEPNARAAIQWTVPTRSLAHTSGC